MRVTSGIGIDVKPPRSAGPQADIDASLGPGSIADPSTSAVGGSQAVRLELGDDLGSDRLDDVAPVEEAPARSRIGAVPDVRGVEHVGQQRTAAVLGDHVPGQRVVPG
jgi:hypothetical protein